jgi:hypothetical protein
MVILTALLFVVGAVTLVVFYRQFGEMQKQTGILNAQAQQAAVDSVEAAKKVETQLEIARKQARAAQDSADAARSQLVQTEKGFILDQWPYLWASKVELSSAPTAGQPLVAVFTFKNIGKSPAQRVQMYKSFGLVNVNPEREDIARAQMEALFKDAKRTMKRGATQTAPPGEEFFTSTQQPIFLTEHDTDLIEQGLSELVAVGGVTYEDVFGKPHETEVCRTIVNKPLTVWHYCAIHNVMR